MPPTFPHALICTVCIPRINRDGFHGFMSSVRFIRGCVSLNLDAATVFCGHRIFPASPVKFPLLFLTFHPECFVMPDVLSDAKTAVFPSRHLTVQEFLMKTEALIWSLQTMCFFYCEDISAVCSEIQRVLTPGGKLICSTYGKKTHAGSQQTGPGF